MQEAGVRQVVHLAEIGDFLLKLSLSILILSVARYFFRANPPDKIRCGLFADFLKLGHMEIGAAGEKDCPINAKDHSTVQKSNGQVH